MYSWNSQNVKSYAHTQSRDQLRKMFNVSLTAHHTHVHTETHTWKSQQWERKIKRNGLMFMIKIRRRVWLARGYKTEFRFYVYFILLSLSVVHGNVWYNLRYCWEKWQICRTETLTWLYVRRKYWSIDNEIISCQDINICALEGQHEMTNCCFDLVK